MRASPSTVPLDRLDRDIYLVLEDFGARAGCAWRERLALLMGTSLRGGRTSITRTGRNEDQF